MWSSRNIGLTWKRQVVVMCPFAARPCPYQQKPNAYQRLIWAGSFLPPVLLSAGLHKCKNMVPKWPFTRSGPPGTAIAPSSTMARASFRSSFGATAVALLSIPPHPLSPWRTAASPSWCGGLIFCLLSPSSWPSGLVLGQENRPKIRCCVPSTDGATSAKLC